MTPEHFVLLYVRDPAASASFYSRLLAQPASETSPNFAMIQFAPGVMLGLWRTAAVKPAALGSPGSCELTWSLPDANAVLAWHARWVSEGVEIAQAPTTLDFGFTFTALDPDGHRLRVMAPTRN